jgi:hypothetical protein
MPEIEADPLLQLVERFISRVREEVERRLEEWEIDLACEEVHEVVGALLARQATLAHEMAKCPSIWNGHIAPLLLRAMAEVYISLAWILQDRVARSREFILYGLGQAKLQLEHQKEALRARGGENPHEKRLIELREQWINRQRWTFLTDVNLGSWSGSSTRKMAEEAGCLDFYNHVYTPFSACTHSMWQHVGIYNLRECSNPLHKLHSVGAVAEVPLDPEYLYLAAKYLQKMFDTFDEATGIKITGDSAFAMLCRELDSFPPQPTPEVDSER